MGATLLFVLMAIIFAFTNVIWRPYIKNILACTIAIFGYLNGYVTSRFLKRFGGTDIKTSASISAVGFPIYIITSLFFERIIDRFNHNTRRYRFMFLLASTVCWFIINAALCFYGAYRGYLTKSEMRVAPVGKVIRPIPPQPTYMSIYVLAPICGLI